MYSIYNMESVVDYFDKLIDEKNKEIEQKYLLKVKNIKMSVDVVDQTDIQSVETDTPKPVSTDNKNIIDYTTKQTINKINAEQDRKFRASKAYKKLCSYSI